MDRIPVAVQHLLDDSLVAGEACLQSLADVAQVGIPCRDEEQKLLVAGKTTFQR